MKMEGEGEEIAHKLFEFMENFLKVKEPRSNLGLTKVITTEGIKAKE